MKKKDKQQVSFDVFKSSCSDMSSLDESETIFYNKFVESPEYSVSNSSIETKSDGRPLTMSDFDDADSSHTVASYQKKKNSNAEKCSDDKVKRSGVQELVDDLARSKDTEKYQFGADVFSSVRRRKSVGMHRQTKKHVLRDNIAPTYEGGLKQDECKDMKPKFDFMVPELGNTSDHSVKIKISSKKKKKISRGINTQSPKMSSVHAQTREASKCDKMQMLLSEDFDIVLPKKVSNHDIKDDKNQGPSEQGKKSSSKQSDTENELKEPVMDSQLQSGLKQREEQKHIDVPLENCACRELCVEIRSGNEEGTVSCDCMKAHESHTSHETKGYHEKTMTAMKALDVIKDQFQTLRISDEKNKRPEKKRKKSKTRKPKKESKVPHESQKKSETLENPEKRSDDLEKTTESKETSKEPAKESKLLDIIDDKPQTVKSLDEQAEALSKMMKTTKKQKKAKVKTEAHVEIKDPPLTIENIDQKPGDQENTKKEEGTQVKPKKETKPAEESGKNVKPATKTRPKSAKPTTKSCVKPCNRVERLENAEFLFAELNLRCQDCNKYKNSYLYLQKRLSPITDECYQCWDKWQQEIYPKVMDFPTTRRSIPLVQGVAHFD